MALSPRPAPVYALMLGALLAGCGSAPAQEVTPDPLAVRVAVVQRYHGSGTIGGIGTVAREREMDLSFRVPGVLARMDVDIGDRVGPGQQLAALDARDLAARLAQAEADVRQAERRLARYETLGDSGAIARAQYEDERSALERARAARAAATYDHGSARLIASAAGVVLARLAQAGETVAAGQAVLRIADLSSPLIFRAAIAARDLVRIAPAASASVWVEGRHEPVAGQVSRIGRLVDDRTGTVDVEIRLAQSTGLVSGMTGRIEIMSSDADSRPGLVAVPAEAVIEARGERAALFLLDRRGARAVRREVRFVGFDGEMALVSGLEPGARIITAGAGYVADGQVVHVAGGHG